MLDKNVRGMIKKALREDKDEKISSMVSNIEFERSNAYKLRDTYMRERQQGASVQEARDVVMKEIEARDVAMKETETRKNSEGI